MGSQWISNAIYNYAWHKIKAVLKGKEQALDPEWPDGISYGC